MPVRALPVVQNWDCHGCTNCCRTYAVGVTEAERMTLAKQAWSLDPEMAGIETVVRDKQIGGYRLNHTAEGTCVFLASDGRCRIHAKFGAAAKPMACRIYPFVLVPGGEHWRVGIRFACPSVSANKGQPLSAHIDELTEYAGLLEADAPQAVDVERPPPLLQAGQTVPWPDLIRFMKAFLDLIGNESYTLEHRLRQVAAVAKMCKQSRFDTVTGPRLNEFLTVMCAAMSDEVQPEPQTVTRPSWISRNLFRQQLAIFSRVDNGPDAGISSRGRFTRLWSAWRFARGSGRIPRLHRQIPDMSFAHAEQPAGPLDAKSTALLTRYYHVKVLSLQFCGAANFGRGFWDGLDSLLLTFPTIMWLSRVLTTTEQSREDAIELALRIVDDHFCYNRLLGAARQTWAIGVMSDRGDIAKLIAWYAR